MPLDAPVVIVGIGQMAGVFARGFLRLGRPIYPVTRQSDIVAVASAVAEPAIALLAVGEDDLSPVLAALPAPWRGRVGLLQNELMPDDWAGIADPTVVVIWFEKKAGRAVKVIRPSPIAGPAARLCVEALGAVDVPAYQVEPPAALLRELAAKNLYILVSNIAGLESGGTVGGLWSSHRPLAESVTDEVLQVLEGRAGVPLPRARLRQVMEDALAADPEHAATGRSAPRRLARTLEHAERLGLELPGLRRLQRTQAGKAV